MEWQTLAPMLVMITAILTAGGVLVLRPISRRVGDLLQGAAEKEQALPGEVGQLRELLASLETRISQLEERQTFSESLLIPEDLRSDPPAPVAVAEPAPPTAAKLPAQPARP